MYPRHFFSIVPAFPTNNNVFVAMSFAEQFRSRWIRVIKPAIESVHQVGTNERLKPHRVDQKTISDSILTEILDGIATSRLIFADISALNDDRESPIRNANVMYEVGVAHASRLPEEVLLFRSDDARLAFDVSNVRVNQYDPENDPDGAMEKIGAALVNAMKEIDLRRNLAAQRAAAGLDAKLIGCLIAIAKNQWLSAKRNMNDTFMAQTLSAMGLVETRYHAVTFDEVVKRRSANWTDYCDLQATPLGMKALEIASNWVGVDGYVAECRARGIDPDKIDEYLKSLPPNDQAKQG